VDVIDVLEKLQRSYASGVVVRRGAAAVVPTRETVVGYSPREYVRNRSSAVAITTSS
jgi:hypothetical protein